MHTHVALKHPNLYMLRLFPKPVKPPFSFHILQDPKFLILEPLIIFLAIRIFFSSLTFTSPLLMVTLANGSQTITKGISSACPLPSLPLTFVLYVPDSPFNLISISTLTRDLNCLITFLITPSHCKTRVQSRRLA